MLISPDRRLHHRTRLLAAGYLHQDICTKDICTQDICPSIFAPGYLHQDICTKDICTQDICTNQIQNDFQHRVKPQFWWQLLLNWCVLGFTSIMIQGKGRPVEGKYFLPPWK